MPRKIQIGYRRQKRSGKPALAFVEIHGSRRYLGEHGTPESLQRYAALLAEWNSGGGVLPPSDLEDLRIVELVDRFWTFADSHYRKPDGRATSEADLVKRAMKFVLKLYSDLPAKDFSPLKLKAVRTAMVQGGWCRKVVNHMIDRVKRMFRWATENELVPPSTYHGLKTVTGLKHSRSEARESEPVRPVPDHIIDETLPFLSPPVAAMVRLQLLTGARPGEICSMRTRDIDTAGKVWTYRPAAHKTEHHGHKRLIYLGPKAQEIIKPFLKHDLSAYLFSPADAEAWHRQRRQEARKTPLRTGNGPGSNRKEKPMRKPGERYNSNSYLHAVAYACDAAFPPPEALRQSEKETRAEHHARLTDEQRKQLREWIQSHRWNPNRLRHNAATRLRAEHGIDMAQTILGHRIGSSVTEIYAEANIQKAREVMLAIG